MTVINGLSLLMECPIREMLPTKEHAHGVSHGLAEVGYDIRIKQNIQFNTVLGKRTVSRREPGCQAFPNTTEDWIVSPGRFILASSIEEFQMPSTMMGIVHDKSTWARRGLSVFNTVIEPGWRGFLTLELVHNGEEDLFIPAGSGIAQVIFHEVTRPAHYEGKYQNQANRPVEALDSVD